MIRIGYACLTMGAPGTELSACTLRTATPERLREVTAHNLEALRRQIAYNAENGIGLFRISSDLIPFGSSIHNTLEWGMEFTETFSEIGAAIGRAEMRVSMHPGQYTVLNSPDPDVVERAAADLTYHEKVLRLLNTDCSNKLILHVGGAYGDKKAAIERFYKNWGRLSDDVRNRVVLENDDRLYNIEDVLELAKRLHIPAVFDNLHHALNPPEQKVPPAEWIERCAETWKTADGRQKIHYSQQNEAGRPGAHSRTISVEPFLSFCEPITQINLDMMLEVKDKNLSALKCICLLSSENGTARLLEREWERNAYAVLERSPEIFGRIEQMLRDDTGCSARRFYELVERAAELPVQADNAISAALAVWSLLEEAADAAEKKHFLACLGRYRNGTAGLQPVKNLLLRLTQKYHRTSILKSYYFLKDQSD